ncbi:MAG: hypothetical protein ACLGPL_11330 [Acidobacteriota bacterium]
MNGYDFNSSEPQQSYGDLIPKDTICKLQINIRPGNAGPDGWLTASQAAGSDVLYLSCEFTVLEGPFAKRKFWQNLTFSGGKVNEKGSSVAGEITRSTLRAMLESARNILPTDMSEKALAARRVQSFEEFDGLVFAAKIGIEKGKDGYEDKNKLASIITPEKKEYQAIMNGTYAPPAAKSSWSGAAATSGQASAPAWAQGAPPAPQPQNGKPVVPTWAQ